MIKLMNYFCKKDTSDYIFVFSCIMYENSRQMTMVVVVVLLLLLMMMMMVVMVLVVLLLLL